MKVKRIEKFLIEITEEENKKLKIIENNIINFENIMKYVQVARIIEIFNIKFEKTNEENFYIILECLVK